VLATVRTNYYQRRADGGPKDWLAIKLDSRKVPGLPLPVPMFETFVCSPKMEAIHLRGGYIARGGLRWSDRHEDYRTEVLGLMKAQTVKNSVIVPVGAKGGFVVKSPVTGDAAAVAAQGVGCYRTFVRGLLDVTDNLVGGKVVPPENVVRYDGEDAYLVVAADKGTATFSDIANELAAERGFWLGDAFASGGSAGYDHKAMGITARGAWVSVRRHLRELGIDPATDGITAVGIGDMSGDVFGNGMLLEPNLRLIAAFDHRHIFLDPDPDPAVSLAERRRMFGLARSSWEDYDESLVSTGGGVWGRQAKFVKLSPQARSALGLEAESLTPDEVIQAILRAPVDLLWNGGIGTYVRGSDESNADVGDKTNDNVRIVASELRCRIVGEGGNLGFTQLGRVEFARRGGRIFTDAIDNSAGVDTSDHEVNIKILLDKIVADGALTTRQRDELLGEMSDEVARHVLADNEGQTLALTIANSHAHSMAPVHLRMLASLERSGRLNRAIEHLPSSDELRERIEQGGGLSTPELSVLLAYAKSAVYADVFASDAPEDSFLTGELHRYFPAPLRARYSAEMVHHPLRREIISTRLTNEVVNRAGMTFVYRLADETGTSAADVVRAHAAAHEIFGIGSIWSRTEKLDADVPALVQRELFLEARKLTERASRHLLYTRPQPLDVARTVEHYGPGLRDLAEHLPELIAGEVSARYAATVERLTGLGVPEGLAGRVAGLPSLLSGLDVVDIAGTAGCALAEAAAPYFALGEVLSLDWMADQIAALPRDDRWHGLARSSLREDLFGVRKTITAAVLGGERSGSGAERVRAWLEEREPASSRCRASLDEAIASGRADLATISVAVREVRSLAL
jgi:glutamate dehydrogenase